MSEVVKFVATTHLRVKRDATEATVARYLRNLRAARNRSSFIYWYIRLYLIQLNNKKQHCIELLPYNAFFFVDIQLPEI